MSSNISDVLQTIVKQIANASGLTTSDNTVKANVIREFIYKGADLLTDAKILAPTVGYDQLDIKGEFPSDADVDYPVAEGATGNEGRITWSNYNFSLELGEGSFKITDQAVLRGFQKLQYQTGMAKVMKAFARKKNANIVSTVFAGAGLTHATGGAWDTNTNYVISDVNLALNSLLESTTADLSMEDLKRATIALPIKAWNIINGLTVIDNVKTTFADYLRTKNPGLTIMPFREMSGATGVGGGNDMLVEIPGFDTARHGVLENPKNPVPLVESKREGAATKWTTREWFATKVIGDSTSVLTSSRIMTITGILGTA
jgi:hypothetical protein